MARRTLLVVLLALAASACSSDSAEEASVTGETRAVPLELPAGEVREFPPPPPTPTGDLAPEVDAALETLFGETLGDGIFLGDEIDAVGTLGSSGDPRVAWLLADLLRFVGDPSTNASLASATNEVLGLDASGFGVWNEATEHLIAWDTPAPPGYLEHKRRLYTLVLPTWEPLFVEGDIDWRHVSWGGVAIDDRAYDSTDEPCNCIPAADNPPVSSADAADWLDDDAVVFGVVVGDEARAYPRRIMEVREMVNDTLGGRDLAIPYCTLCGSAQAYFTDELPDGIDRPVLRTSGLLIRSNKVMYDITSQSVFDTFRGNAVTGPLFEQGVVLPQASVVTSTWGAWKVAHPDTTVLIEELALGRDFDFRSGRDADGPIFPIGDVDDRLPVQADVLGVFTADGTPVAFHVETAVSALQRGRAVTFADVVVELDGGGIRASDTAGNDLGAHQSFWFAWSQFHPDTEVWDPAA